MEMNQSPAAQDAGACTAPRRVHSNGVFFRILDTVALQLARHMAIPAENVEAFRATFRSIMEQQIVDAIGGDYLRITGWAVLPSTRLARRQRIVASIDAGDSDAQIASRELLTWQAVQKIRAQLQRASATKST